MKYITDLIDIKTKRRSGLKIESVGFVVAHDTGNDGSTARQNVDYYKRTANDASGSAHIFVDDKEAIMCVPAFEDTEKAWHVRYDVRTDNEMFGDDANDIAIGVELCYFSNDKERSLLAYKNYVDILVDLFVFHNLLPIELTGHMLLDETRRSDPNNALQYINKDFDDLCCDVENGYFERIKPYVDYSDILELCLDSPDAMIESIDTIKEIAQLGSDLGDIEQLKYLDEVIIKVFDYAYALGENIEKRK